MLYLAVPGLLYGSLNSANILLGQHFSVAFSPAADVKDNGENRLMDGGGFLELGMV